MVIIGPLHCPVWWVMFIGVPLVVDRLLTPFLFATIRLILCMCLLNFMRLSIALMFEYSLVLSVNSVVFRLLVVLVLGMLSIELNACVFLGMCSNFRVCVLVTVVLSR